MAIGKAMPSDTAVRNRVLGIRLRASGRAGTFCHSESPKSPRTQPQMLRPNRTYRGSLSPSDSRSSSRIDSGASAGSIRRTGSPTSCSMRKTKMSTPRTTNTE